MAVNFYLLKELANVPANINFLIISTSSRPSPIEEKENKELPLLLGED